MNYVMIYRSKHPHKVNKTANPLGTITGEWGTEAEAVAYAQSRAYVHEVLAVGRSGKGGYHLNKVVDKPTIGGAVTEL